MKEASKKATSTTLAHMLAVMALLVIASVLFYGGSHRQLEQSQANFSK
jgi:uncharacterized protein HemX